MNHIEKETILTIVKELKKEMQKREQAKVSA